MSDLRVLPQLLTLHRSLVDHAAHFRLRVLCMDAHSAAFLRERRLAHTELVALGELEGADRALAPARRERSWLEYCWTATPAFCRYALELAPAGAVLAWIDADVEFMRDPHLLLDELGDGSVLLTPHEYRRAYPAAWSAPKLTALYGRFNGGTIVFRRDDVGLAAAGLWRERTLSWCHDRPEPGRFGNQLHLDDFPQRFGRVSLVRVPGGVLGPWNGGGFRVRRDRDGPTADGRPVIAYHFQSLRLRPAGARFLAPSANVFRLAGAPRSLEARAEPHYRVSTSERRVFWRPHVRRLAQAVIEVLEAEPRFAETWLPAPTRAQRLDALQEYLTLQASRLSIPSRRTVRRAVAPKRSSY